MACSDCFGRCIECDADGLPAFTGPDVPIIVQGAGITVTNGVPTNCGLPVTISANFPPPVGTHAAVIPLPAYVPFQSYEQSAIPGLNVPDFGNIIRSQVVLATVTNPDPNNPAIIIVRGQSDVAAAVEMPVPSSQHSWGIELMVRFDGGGWQKIHEESFAVELGPLKYAPTSKNMVAWHGPIAPGGTVSIDAAVRISKYFTGAGAYPGKLALKIADFSCVVMAFESIP